MVLSISGKLRLGFAIVTLLTAIVGIVSVAGMQSLRTSGLSMYEQQVLGIEKAGKAMHAFERLRIDCRSIVIFSLYDDKKGALDTQVLFENNVADFRELMLECNELSTTDELRNFNDVIMDLFENYYMPRAQTIIEKSIEDIPDHNNRLYVYVLLAYANDKSDQIESLMTGMTELNVAIAQQTSVENEALTLRYIVVLTALIAVVVAFAVVVALYIVRSIMKPISESTFVLGRISTGDFEARIEGDYKNEFEKIKDAVNSMAVDIKARELMISGITYASMIQRSLLPPDNLFDEAFSDYSVKWEPKDIVSGDIYWIRNFDDGTVLCVCDCTGHGTHGALLTMLVMSTLRTAVDESNYKDTAAIVWEIEKSFKSTLGKDRDTSVRDGCDIAVVFISHDGTVKVSAGNISVFVCNGEEVTRIKGQRIWVGGGEIENKDCIKTVTVPVDPRNAFYIASDGLYEQVGGEERIPFGYEALEKIIVENHNEKHDVVSEKIWQAFEDYRGSNPRRDDYELITFTPKIKRQERMNDNV